MPLRNFLEEFGLDRELIARDRDFSMRFAEAYERTTREILKREQGPWFSQTMAAATEYRRAGAHSLLLSERGTAVQMFRRAGRLYAGVRRPYALMMFSCADAEIGSILASAHDFGVGDGIDRMQLPYLLLALAASEEGRDREAFAIIRDQLAPSQTAPIGVLGIPIGAYLDLASELALGDSSLQRWAEALAPFLITYSTAIRRCMDDTYHWERIAFPFHPAEPDVIGVLFCVEAALRRRQQPLMLQLISGMPLSEVAANLLYNVILERFEGGEHEPPLAYR
jgi:hypothetical protein